MLFSNINHSILPLITLNGTCVERSSSVCFLGVELDDKLKFNKHINNVSSKISKTIGILCKLAYYIPKSILITLYHSLIEPYLNYCPIIFGGAYSSHIQPLEVAQRKCVRIINGVHRQSNANPLFANLEILKFNDLYKIQLGIYMYKNIHNFVDSSPNHNYDMRHSLFYPVFQRLTLTQRQSVAYQAPLNWNSIPLSIRNSQSLKAFKSCYKRHLVSLY